MKSIATVLLWITAAGIAVRIIWKIAHGQKIVLGGGWSPKLIRMVAIILVTLGVEIPGTRGNDQATPPLDHQQGISLEDGLLPGNVTLNSMRTWLACQSSGGSWIKFKQEYTDYIQRARHSADETQSMTRRIIQVTDNDLPTLRKLLLPIVVTPAAPIAPVTLSDIRKCIDELEKQGYYDHWVNAFLWRKSSEANDWNRDQAIDLYGRFSRYARIVNALIKAQAEVKPILAPPRAWMSKAGPSHMQFKQEKEDAAKMLAAAGKAFVTTDSGTWRKDGLVVLTIPAGAAPLILIRGEQHQELSEGDSFAFGRLDLIEAGRSGNPVTLAQGSIGRLQFPAGKLISVWDLPNSLSEAARAKLRKLIAAALADDAKAADELELLLPLAQKEIRERLASSPDAPGAPRLRMLLSLFDDAIVPAVTEENTP